jgi:hypothetical protein
MRRALREWQLGTRDSGFMHEAHAEQLCASGQPLNEVARSNRIYPLERVLDTAERVGRAGEAREFRGRLTDADPTVRYWAVMGLRAAGDEGRTAKDALRLALRDDSVPVRIEAAGLLVHQFDDAEALRELTNQLRSKSYLVATHAARTLQLLGEKAKPVFPEMRAALAADPHLYVQFSLSNAVNQAVPVEPAFP